MDKFTINGNDYNIEGVTNCTAFQIDSHVVFNNLTFKDCTVNFYLSSEVVFNNVNFINCSGYSGFIWVMDNVTLNNCVFQMKDGNNEVIANNGETLTINNCLFSGMDFKKHSCVEVNRGNLIVENTTFANITSRMGAAISYKGWNLTIKRSKFINLNALSGGAIIGKFFPKPDSHSSGYLQFDPFLIEGCEFINLTSLDNAGAIYFDLDSGSEHIKQSLNIFNSTFSNCKSSFGGAIADQGGILNIADSTFENNFASFEGGAFYTTWASLNLVNVSMLNNSAEKNAGAIFFDKGNLSIRQSNIIGNNVLNGLENSANAVYANDVGMYISNSTFDNGGIAVYANFAGDSKIENITRNNDVLSLNNTDYIVSVESNGIKLNFTNNSIVVDRLPSKFNYYDWGWVTPEKYLGDNDDCWAFATVAAIESTLLKTTGVQYNLSQNYVQKFQLKYALNGDLRISLTGFAYSGLGYALSWYGVLPMETAYDDRGMVADTDFSDSRIHVQDAMLIYGKTNDTVDLIKWALLKYGPVAVQIILNDADEPDLNTTGDDIAIMEHDIHFVTIVGWDDDYQDPQRDDLRGAFICMDSIADFHTRFSYNFATLLAPDIYAIIPQNAGICYIFENDIDYHVNYQTDLTALAGFNGNYTYYSNEFVSKYSELIGAVGTYFNESGIDYSFDVYVNDAKVHSQSGVSEFAGFRTIVLNKYIPVKAGDKFKVVFKNNALPFQAYSRQHYMQGMSFVSNDGKSWSDITLENKTVCLKVYTVKDDSKIINNKNIAVDYSGGFYFSVKVVTADGRAVGAGAVVKFKINGKTTTVKTDSNGIAKIKIADLPKKYTLTTTYNGKSYKNTVTVKQVLTASKVTIIKKTAKNLVLKAKLKINGKLVKGKKITFKFNGKKYTVKTNAKGIAQKTLTKNIIKKLKKGKTYNLQVTYLKNTIKTTVKVK